MTHEYFYLFPVNPLWLVGNNTVVFCRDKRLSFELQTVNHKVNEELWRHGSEPITAELSNSVIDEDGPVSPCSVSQVHAGRLWRATAVQPADSLRPPPWCQSRDSRGEAAQLWRPAEVRGHISHSLETLSNSRRQQWVFVFAGTSDCTWGPTTSCSPRTSEPSSWTTTEQSEATRSTGTTTSRDTLSVRAIGQKTSDQAPTRVN